ncbi:MAG: glycosyltransferase family 39 protein [Anaerolineaceae bacterium]|nr:glycosyltransferase family 39 protein [Anaerolineaceae bacterium]
MTAPVWLWALAPMLLAAALGIPLLDYDAFNGDETSHLVAAGALQDGNHSLAEVWENIAPRVATGWPLLLSRWGPLVGWSEAAIRSLSIFAGVLTIAVVYRAGTDLFSPLAAVFAAMLLGASVFHHAYMIRAGPYASVALFATMTVWGYWRVTTQPGASCRRAQAGFFTGGIGLTYSHFLAALLLPILCLYHLLFAPRGMRWWRTLLLFTLIAIAGAVQVPLLPDGWTYTEQEDIGSRAHNAAGFLSRLLYALSNGMLEVSLSDALAFLAIVTLLAWTINHTMRRRVASPHGFLIWAGTFLLTSVLMLNEFLGILADTRVRYLMPLWPICAILAGAGLWRLSLLRRFLAPGLLAFWVLQGTYVSSATDFRYELGHFFRLDLHHLRQEIPDLVPASDYLAVEYHAASPDKRHYRYYHFQSLDRPWGIFYRNSDVPFETLGTELHEHPWFWMLYLSRHHAELVEMVTDQGRVSCEIALDEWGYILERLARSKRECLMTLPRLASYRGLTLSDPEMLLRGNSLRLSAGVYRPAGEHPADLSLAIHIMDPHTGRRVAQGDVGVGPGEFAQLRSVIDVSALPPGNYEVHMALYHWQTGERLNTHDLQTGAVSDMHVLQRFRIG